MRTGCVCVLKRRGRRIEREALEGDRGSGVCVSFQVMEMEMMGTLSTAGEGSLSESAWRNLKLVLVLWPPPHAHMLDSVSLCFRAWKSTFRSVHRKAVQNAGEIPIVSTMIMMRAAVRCSSFIVRRPPISHLPSARLHDWRLQICQNPQTGDGDGDGRGDSRGRRTIASCYAVSPAPEINDRVMG